MTKKDRIRMGKVFRKAAELIEDESEDFCCYAIASVQRLPKDCYTNSEAGLFFNSIYQESANSIGNSYGAYFEFMNEYEYMPSVRNRRITGLLLAAELVESGEEF